MVKRRGPGRPPGSKNKVKARPMVRRGRPPGSKNKAQKAPSAPARQDTPQVTMSLEGFFASNPMSAVQFCTTLLRISDEIANLRASINSTRNADLSRIDGAFMGVQKQSGEFAKILTEVNSNLVGLTSRVDALEGSSETHESPANGIDEEAAEASADA